MPCDYKNYPSDWKALSKFIRFERAGGKCEWCGAVHGEANPATGSKVVLTVAHLDHDTKNNEQDNLKALCQKCHLTYDAKHHAKNARATRNKKQGLVSMFTKEDL